MIQALFAQLARIFYRVHVTGPEVPSFGPVLLVANHPNSLLDPALLLCATGRPVRFLAKATLFERGKTPGLVRWLVRSAGSIPVHRRIDGHAPAGALDNTFSAVYASLADGDTVALFPEGVSHTEPFLQPLKTGAARIALEGAARLGVPITIVPVGIVLREPSVFRSEVLVVRGAPIPWEDLLAEATPHEAGLHADTPTTPHDPARTTPAEAEPQAEAPGAAQVRELTRRIAAGLTDVTLNHESWDDADLVDFAEQVHATTLSAPRDPRERYARQHRGASLFTTLRRRGDATWEVLAQDLRRHRRVLRLTRLSPGELAAIAPAARQNPFPDSPGPAEASGETPAGAEEATEVGAGPRSGSGSGTGAGLGAGAGAGTGLGNGTGTGVRAGVGAGSAPLLPWGPFALRWASLLFLGGLTAVGTLFWFLPYQATGRLAARLSARQGRDVLGTTKVLLGAVIFVIWTMGWATLGGLVTGFFGFLFLLWGLPALGALTLMTAEGWQTALAESRLLLTRAFFRERLAGLADRQRTLALRLDHLIDAAAAAD